MQTAAIPVSEFNSQSPEMRSGVPVLFRPSREEFEREYLRPGRPVIIAGLVEGWRVSREWSLESLAAQLAGRSLQVFTPGRQFQLTGEALFETLERDDIAQYPYLVGSTGQPEGTAGLPIDIGPELPPLFSARDVVNRLFYFGRRTYTPLHYHPTVEAVSCQILGDKRFLLFPPHQFPFLYAKPFHDVDFLDSWIADPDHVDLRKFPLFRQAQPIDVVVRQGELLFIPIHWWHAVWGTERIGLSLTFFWRPRWQQMMWPPSGRWHHWGSLLVRRRKYFFWDLREWLRGNGPELVTSER